MDTAQKNGFSLNLDEGFAKRLIEEYVKDADLREEEEKGYDPITAELLYFPVFFDPPSEEEIRELIEASFWASLLKEEGRFHGFTVVFSHPEGISIDEPEEISFNDLLKLSAEKLAKLATGLPPPTLIGVWLFEEDPVTGASGLYIWGFARKLPSFSFEEMPGLSIQALREGELVVSLPDGPRAVVTITTGARFIDRERASDLGFAGERDLKEIARAMRGHGHGGTLLVLPDDALPASIQREGSHTLSLPFSDARLAVEARDRAIERQREVFEHHSSQRTSRRERTVNEPDEAGSARRALRWIGQLTAVDGATIVTRKMEVLGFGAKISVLGEVIDEVLLSEPFEGSEWVPTKISELGGTRRQSAARFVCKERDCNAIVASQDGEVYFMSWDRGQGRLRVIRHAEFVLV